MKKCQRLWKRGRLHFKFLQHKKKQKKARCLVFFVAFSDFFIHNQNTLKITKEVILLLLLVVVVVIVQKHTPTIIQEKFSLKLTLAVSASSWVCQSISSKYITQTNGRKICVFWYWNFFGIVTFFLFGKFCCILHYAVVYELFRWVCETVVVSGVSFPFLLFLRRYTHTSVQWQNKQQPPNLQPKQISSTKRYQRLLFIY